MFAVFISHRALFSSNVDGENTSDADTSTTRTTGCSTRMSSMSILLTFCLFCPPPSPCPIYTHISVYLHSLPYVSCSCLTRFATQSSRRARSLCRSSRLTVPPGRSPPFPSLLRRPPLARGPGSWRAIRRPHVMAVSHSFLCPPPLVLAASHCYLLQPTRHPLPAAWCRRMT